MDLRKLRKAELSLLCEELALEWDETMKKSELLKQIEESGSSAESIEVAWELVQKDLKEEEAKRIHEKEREEAKMVYEKEKEERAMKRLELEIERQRLMGQGATNSIPERASELGSYSMDRSIQPYKIGEDIGLFLVNFERACQRNGFALSTWSQRLLTLLPCEAANVVARLSAREADDYEKVKSTLLKKYRLCAEAFRQRFRDSTKKLDEDYAEFAYGLKTNLTEWLKSAEVYESRDKIIECICLEQFYQRLPQPIKLWVQDREGVDTVEKAAELADEYARRRKLNAEEGQVERGNTSRKYFPTKKASQSRNPEQVETARRAPEKSNHSYESGSSSEMAQKAVKKQFEARPPLRCYNCQGLGHVSAVCKKPRVVFSYVDSSEENLELLRPYLHDLKVNGKPCRVLRDSAATTDVVHPSYVAAEDFTGEVTWIKQVLEEHSVCLPMAKVTISGPFGELVTEAAVSKMVPVEYPYLFSNRSDRLLRERGQKFGEGTVQALTRSKTRELAAQLSQNLGENTPESEQTVPKSAETTVEEPRLAAVEAGGEIVEGKGGEDAEAEEPESVGDERGLLSAPGSPSFERLLRVDRNSLSAEQKKDPSLARLHITAKEGISMRNVTIHEKEGLMYRHYRDRKGKVLDQLIVPEKYRKDILDLCHGNGWSGHLGVNKTKERLLMEYYWPGCFKDVELLVRSCDACQRVGKPGDKCKAPLRLVPLITEPFRRLVIDVVGPLPKSKSGYKYLLTMLCPATKFPEAVPLRELNSSEIVDALLATFSRIGFPNEIQADQGTVFTSALTTTFLRKCGVRLLHSSVYHPQSNSVEKLHSVLKRVLRALCYERKEDWESCLPATLFALRTVPHEATGFTPAELVYGRNLRSPLRMLREFWEGTGENQTVVSYVLELLERLSVMRKLVEKNMKIAQESAKAYYDRNARSRTFNEGDKVMILRPSQRNRLEVQWEGPIEVAHKLSDTNYALRMPGRGNKVKIYHCNLMKPYVGRGEVVSMILNTPEEMAGDLPSLGTDMRTERSVDEILSLSANKGVLEKQQVEDLRAVLGEFRDRFSGRPGKTNLITHEIELTVSKPIKSKAYRVSPRQHEIIEGEIKRMLELGVIEPTESDYTSPMILVEVPGKEPRPCVDYRKLNAITRDQLYPIPNIEERIERVSGANYITTFDLVRGYWQVPLSESASRYAAFISPVGTFRPLVLSFGLKNAPFSFCKLMDIVLKDLHNYAVPYLDDIAVFSKTWEEHITHLRTVLTRLREAGLTIKAEKCSFGCSQVTYLGHVVGRGTRKPSELKMGPIGEFPRPQTKRDVRSFLGLVGYYQRYIPNYSQIASPLTDALRKGKPERLAWDTEKEGAFSELKRVLASMPVLRTPDYTKEFIVQCDASDRGLGVVLCQVGEDGEEHPILFASRKLTVREEAYSASEKECACLVWAAQKRSCYLYGAKFTFETDHCPLTWLRQMSKRNGRLLRWSLILQEYNFSVRYKKGTMNGNADGLSRLV